jgi:hypothetical protein
VEDSKIVDQELRPKTFIYLGRKKPGEGLEKVMTSATRELNKSDSSGNNNEQKRKYYDELEPSLKVMEYIFSHEKRSLNRYSILRPTIIPERGFDSLLHSCKKIFLKDRSGERVKTETMSFFDELISGESDLRENKAIIIVPASFNTGNICIDNAKSFLKDAQ